MRRTIYLESLAKAHILKTAFVYNLWQIGKKYYGCKEIVVYDNTCVMFRRKFTISDELNISIR